jgi:hypothetical protein
LSTCFGQNFWPQFSDKILSGFFCLLNSKELLCL